jgi:hypothetical protein
VPCEVTLVDPVFPKKPAKIHRVIQFRNQDGFPVRYALPISAAVCLDKKCKMVNATLFWNVAGDYQRLECPPGKPLTKKEHTPFEPKDYDRLDQILGDRNSILRNHSLAYLAKPIVVGEQVDGVSGATPETVRQAVVEDAAWTTWVMWHYANGEIVPQLQRITQRSCTPGYLKHLLCRENLSESKFALGILLEHHPGDEQYLDSVLVALEKGDRGNVELALRFLKRVVVDKPRLHRKLIESCRRVNVNYVPMVVDFFSKDPQLPTETLEQLTQHLDDFPYFPVHLILKLLEDRSFFSAKMEADVLRLLESDSFFIARRASEFLRKQKLSPQAQVRLAAFLEQNRDRL